MKKIFSKEKQKENTVYSLMNSSTVLATLGVSKGIFLTKQEKSDWKDIDHNFAKNARQSDKTYQQLWEELGLTKKDAHEWIQFGFEPEDYWTIKRWEERGFNSSQIKEWLEIGLNKYSDVDFAAYLRGKNYSLTEANNNLIELRKEHKKWEDISLPAQECLDFLYPLESRKRVKKIDINGFIKRKLNGSLKIDNFPHVELIYCYENNITNLIIDNCPQVSEIWCSNNQLSNLYINNCPKIKDFKVHNNQLLDLKFLAKLNKEKLTILDISNNKLLSQDLSVFSKFINLEELMIGNYSNYFDKERISKGIYNRWHGSLEPLKGLKHLKRLGISNTDINDGVEYLCEDTIEEISHYSTERSESRVNEIVEKLNLLLERNLKKWTDIHSSFKSEYWLRNSWKEQGFDYQRTKQWIGAGLWPREYEFAKYLEKENYDPLKLLSADLNKLRKDYYNVQNWLERKNYSSEKITSLTDLSWKMLWGDLTINNWSKLENVNCSNNQLTKLTFFNLPKLTKINCFLNYTISKLTIIDCPEIRELVLSHNLLTDLDFLNDIDSKKLIVLRIEKNKFLPQDLSVFEKFINLEQLWIEDNLFYGSLKPLRNLTKLKHLSFSNTNVSLDFENLPANINEIKEMAHHREKQSNIERGIFREMQNYLKKKDSQSVIDRLEDTFSVQLWRADQISYQKLQEILNKINPNLDINELLGKIFFNVRTGAFEGDFEGLTYLLKISKSLLEEKQKKIENLITLIQKQKEKIVNAYLFFALEKGLLKELITSHIELRKSGKKHNLKVATLYNSLERKLGEGKMKEVDNVLSDCDELIGWENELEITNKSSIDFFSKQVINIINSSINVQNGHAFIGNDIGDHANFTYKAVENGWEENLAKRSKEIWTDIDNDFTEELIQSWLIESFSYPQTQDWINIGLTAHDANFCAWIRDTKHLTAEDVLNYQDLNQLRTEYQTEQLITHAVQLPK